MAVEARHLNLFPTKVLNSRELIVNGVDSNGNVFGAPIGYGVVTSEMTTATVPMSGSAIDDVSPAKTAAMKSDSGLTYAAVPISRKRSRDLINPLLLPSFPAGVQNQTADNRCGHFSFLGEDISYQMQLQELQIDRFIAQHTEKVRMEIEERRKRYSRRIVAAMEENIMKKLKSKEEEIEKMGKLNWALEERVKSLRVESQIWRDLAQTNEATANALRCNLEQVLAQVHDEQPTADDAALADDGQSCCGSNSDEIDRRTVADHASACAGDGGYKSNNRTCRSCGRMESCVLLLPCRHLCLCTVCGSSLHTCPVCNSVKTASVHVSICS